MNIRTGSGNVEVRTFSPEDPNFSLSGSNIAALLDAQGASWTGRLVTPQSALNSTIGVYRCVMLLSNSVGGSPIKLWHREDARNRAEVEASRDPTARMISQTPNPEMDAVQFWGDGVTGNMALHGEAFCEVVRNGSGRPIELWPLRPDKMRVVRDPDTGKKVWIYTLPSGEQRRLPADTVMHIPLFLNGLRGISPIAVARNAIAAEQAGAEATGRSFATGAMPPSIVTIPKSTTQDKFKERAGAVRSTLETLHTGLNNSQRMAVLEEGYTWQASGMNNNDAQFLELRRYELREIATLYGIPVHKLGDLERATFSNIEHQSIEYLTDAVRPYYERIESAISHNLGLVPGIRTLLDEDLYAEFNDAALLRTDHKTQWEGFEIAIRNRVLSPEDVAGILNYPFNAERPAGYENPNTNTGDPAASLTPPGASA